MTPFHPDRRTVLLASGTVLTVAIAGCLGNGDDDDEPDDETNGIALDDDPEGAVEEWMDSENAAGWDGDIADLTGEDEVTIENGANPPDYQNDPPVARVDAGTTVTWEWVSDGHTLHEEESTTTFDEMTNIEDEGFTQEMTLEDDGAVLYYCQPHRGQGHVGGIIVE